MAPGARLRELTTEGALSGLFLVAALAMAFLLPRSAPLDLPLAAWLVGLCCVVLLIEFEVGAGRTRPVQLVLLPMLLLLPPALVPLLVAAAHVLVRVPGSWSGADAGPPRHPRARRLVVLRPARAAAGRRRHARRVPALQALVVLVALAAQFAVDFVVSAAAAPRRARRARSARELTPSPGSTSSTCC